MEKTDDFTWPVRVYYEDTDASGVVYHSSYLHFMERARTEWLRSYGFEQDELRARNVVLTVSRASLEYLRPARFNDMLAVGVKIARYGRASLNLTQHVSHAAGALLCRGEVRIACVDAENFRPCAIPVKMLSELTREH